MDWRYFWGLFLTLFIGIKADTNAELYRVEGKVSLPDTERADWYTRARILINGGEYVGFLRDDGSFVVNHLPPGSYVIEVTSPDYIYEPTRIEINSKGKIRARKLNLIQTSSVLQVPYPLKFKPKSKFKYFQTREQWRVTDFLFNPMVLMMVLPLLLIMVMPRLMNAADPDTQREMQQTLQNTNLPDMPDIAETLTSFFGGGKKEKVKAVKASKKRS
ncbi:hypothetical protein CHUAL_005183 [Chamberlinius hualienensis]